MEATQGYTATYNDIRNSILIRQFEFIDNEIDKKKLIISLREEALDEVIFKLISCGYDAQTNRYFVFNPSRRPLTLYDYGYQHGLLVGFMASGLIVFLWQIKTHIQ